MPDPSLTNAASLVPVGQFAGKPAMPLTRPVIVIGSGKNSRILLKSDTVSTTHSLLIHTNAGWYVRDLASRTHTILNGKPVREAPLRNGDTLTIGAFVFQFVSVDPKDAKPAPIKPAAFEITGAEIPVPVDTRTMLVGRRPGCEVRLIEESVSLIQAVVFEQDGQHFVRDLYSRNGTRLNNQKVHQAPLAFGDVVRVGETFMKYVPDEVPQWIAEDGHGTALGVPSPTISLADIAPSGGILLDDVTSPPAPARRLDEAAAAEPEDDDAVVPLGRPMRGHAVEVEPVLTPRVPQAPVPEAPPVEIEPLRVAESPEPPVEPAVEVPANRPAKLPAVAAAPVAPALPIELAAPTPAPATQQIPPVPMVGEPLPAAADDVEADVLGLAPPVTATFTDLPELVPVPTVTIVPAAAAPVVPANDDSLSNVPALGGLVDQLESAVRSESTASPAIEPIVAETPEADAVAADLATPVEAIDEAGFESETTAVESALRSESPLVEPLAARPAGVEPSPEAALDPIRIDAPLAADDLIEAETAAVDSALHGPLVEDEPAVAPFAYHDEPVHEDVALTHEAVVPPLIADAPDEVLVSHEPLNVVDPLASHVPLSVGVVEPSAAVEPTPNEHHEGELPLAVPTIADLLPATPEAIELAELQAQIRAAIADPSVLLDKPLLPPDQPLVAAEDALQSKAARRARMIAEMLESNEELEEEAEREAQSIEFAPVPEAAIPKPEPIVEPESTPIIDEDLVAKAAEQAKAAIPTVKPVEEPPAPVIIPGDIAASAADAPTITPALPVAAIAVTDDAAAIAATLEADVSTTPLSKHALEAAHVEVTPPTPLAAPPVVIDVAAPGTGTFNPADSLATAASLDAGFVEDAEAPQADEIRARLAAFEPDAPADVAPAFSATALPSGEDAIAEEEIDAAAAKLAAADEIVAAGDALDESILAVDAVEPSTVAEPIAAEAVIEAAVEPLTVETPIEPTLTSRDEIVEVPFADAVIAADEVTGPAVRADEPISESADDITIDLSAGDETIAEPIAARPEIPEPVTKPIASEPSPIVTIRAIEDADQAESTIEQAIAEPPATLEAIAAAPPVEADVLPIEPMPGAAALSGEPTEAPIELDEARAPIEVDQLNAGDVIETTPHDAGVAEQSRAEFAEIAAAETGHGPHAVDAASRLEDGTPLDTAEIDRPGNAGAIEPTEVVSSAAIIDEVLRATEPTEAVASAADAPAEPPPPVEGAGKRVRIRRGGRFAKKSEPVATPPTTPDVVNEDAAPAEAETPAPGVRRPVIPNADQLNDLGDAAKKPTKGRRPRRMSPAERAISDAEAAEAAATASITAAAQEATHVPFDPAALAAAGTVEHAIEAPAPETPVAEASSAVQDVLAPTGEEVAASNAVAPVLGLDEPGTATVSADEAAAIEAEFAAGLDVAADVAADVTADVPGEPVVEAARVADAEPTDATVAGDLGALSTASIDAEATELLAEQAGEPTTVELESLGTPAIDEAVDATVTAESIAAIDVAGEAEPVEPVAQIQGEANAEPIAPVLEAIDEAPAILSTTPIEPFAAVPASATELVVDADETQRLELAAVAEGSAEPIAASDVEAAAAPTGKIDEPTLAGASLIAAEPVELLSAADDVVTTTEVGETTDIVAIDVPVEAEQLGDVQAIFEARAPEAEGTLLAAAAEAIAPSADAPAATTISDTAGLAPTGPTTDADWAQAAVERLPRRQAMTFVPESAQPPATAPAAGAGNMARPPTAVVNVDVPDEEELEKQFNDAFAEALKMAEGVSLAGGAQAAAEASKPAGPRPAPVEWKLDESLLEALEKPPVNPQPVAPRPTSAAQIADEWKLDESLLNKALEEARRPQPPAPPRPAPPAGSRKWELDESLLEQAGNVDPIRGALSPLARTPTAATPPGSPPAVGPGAGGSLNLGGIGFAGASSASDELELPASWGVPSLPPPRVGPSSIKPFKRRPTRQRRPVMGETPAEPTAEAPAATPAPIPAAAPLAPSLTTRVPTAADEIEPLAEASPPDAERREAAPASAAVVDAALLDAIAAETDERDTAGQDATAEAPVAAANDEEQYLQPMTGTLRAEETFRDEEESAAAATSTPAAEQPVAPVLPPRPRRERPARPTRGEAAVDQSFDADDANAAASPFAAQALPLVDAFSAAPSPDELNDVLSRIGGTSAGNGRVEDRPPVTQDRPIPATREAAELDEVLGELPQAIPFASHAPIDVGPSRGAAPGVRRSRQRTSKLPLTLLLMGVLMTAAVTAATYVPVPATVRGAVTFDNLGKINREDRRTLQAERLAKLDPSVMRAARLKLDDKHGDSFLDRPELFALVRDSAKFEDASDGSVSLVLEHKSTTSRSEVDRESMQQLLEVYAAANRDLIDARNKVVQAIEKQEAALKLEIARHAYLDAQRAKLEPTISARPDPEEMDAAESKLKQLDERRQAAVRQLDQRQAELQRLEANQAALGPAAPREAEHAVDTSRKVATFARAAYDWFFARATAAAEGRPERQGVMLVDADDAALANAISTLEDDGRLESATQPSTQPVAAAPATQPADRMEAQLAAAKDELASLTTRRDAIKQTLNKLLGAQSPESRAARESFDRSLESFAAEVDAARKAMGDSPEIVRYIESAKQLQDRIRETTDTLVRRQQQQLTRMMELRRRLAELTDATREQRYKDDEKLQEYQTNLSIEERRLNAARSSNVDAVQVAELERSVESLRSMAAARKQILDDPMASTVTRELNAMIDTAKTEMEADRKSNDQILAEIQNSFRQGQQPAIERLPAEQKKVAAAMTERLATIELARRRYTNALSIAAGGDEPAINDQRNQLAEVENKIEAANQTIASLQTRVDEQQRTATAALAAQVAEMEKRAKLAEQVDAARTAVVSARSQREEAERVYEAQRTVVSQLEAKSNAGREAMVEKDKISAELLSVDAAIKDAGPKLEAQRQALAFTVVPSESKRPTAFIVDAQRADPRLMYGLVGALGVAMAFAPLVWKEGRAGRGGPTTHRPATPNPRIREDEHLPTHARPA